MSSTRKTALITGASAGIGAEFARQLAQAGQDLILTARRKDRLEALAEKLSRAHGINALALACDLGSQGAVEQLCFELEQKNLAVDVLINNAGYGVPGHFNAPDWETHEAFMNVLVNAPMELCYRLLPAMQKAGWGRIINVASLAAHVPGSPGHTLYGASKAFMVRFSESLFFENKSRGVRVQGLCPGFTYSEFHDVTKTRELVSKMPDYMWQTAAEVVSTSLAAIESSKPKPVVITGRVNRFIARLTRIVPTTMAYRMMERRANRFRNAD